MGRRSEVPVTERREESGASWRTAGETALTGDRQWTILYRSEVRGVHPRAVQPRPNPVPDAAATGTARAVSPDSGNRGGVLEILLRIFSMPEHT
jgi:hypothetical protein